MAPLHAPPHSPRNDTQGAYDRLTPSVIMISGNSHEGNLKGRFVVFDQQFLRGVSLQKCY